MIKPKFLKSLLLLNTLSFLNHIYLLIHFAHLERPPFVTENNSCIYMVFHSASSWKRMVASEWNTNVCPLCQPIPSIKVSRVTYIENGIHVHGKSIVEGDYCTKYHLLWYLNWGSDLWALSLSLRCLTNYILYCHPTSSSVSCLTICNVHVADVIHLYILFSFKGAGLFIFICFTPQSTIFRMFKV